MGPHDTSTIARVAIAPGRRAALRISAGQQADRTLLVRSAGDVVVERDDLAHAASPAPAADETMSAAGRQVRRRCPEREAEGTRVRKPDAAI